MNEMSEPPDERFPPLIWQTYKSAEELPLEAAPCIHSWISKNPGWNYQFCSDADMWDFFGNFFPPATVELFESLPLGVMKADLWRYAVLYEFGGVYCDLDTVCMVPLDEWLDRTQETSLHVAIESSGGPFFCQWCIAAARHHPVLAHAIKLVGERVTEDGGVHEARLHYVHHYTGPGVWTAAVQRYLGCQMHPIEILNDKECWLGRDIAIYPSDFFDGRTVRHFNGSYHWRNSPSGYASWLYERKDVGRLARPC